MTGTANAKISGDIRQEFTGIRMDVQKHLALEVKLDHARILLAQQIPELVVERAHLLLDSLLGILMEDAIALLADAPIDVKNGFYALELRARIKGAIFLNPPALTFSFDQRLVHGGVAAGGVFVSVGIAAAIFLQPFVHPILIGLGSIVAAAVAFRVCYSAGTDSARRKLQSDFLMYLDKSESQIKEWLTAVECSFDEALDGFLFQYGIRRAKRYE